MQMHRKIIIFICDNIILFMSFIKGKIFDHIYYNLEKIYYILETLRDILYD
jgi:hypothetical protein